MKPTKTSGTPVPAPSNVKPLRPLQPPGQRYGAPPPLERPRGKRYRCVHCAEEFTGEWPGHYCPNCQAANSIRKIKGPIMQFQRCEAASGHEGVSCTQPVGHEGPHKASVEWECADAGT